MREMAVAFVIKFNESCGGSQQRSVPAFLQKPSVCTSSSNEFNGAILSNGWHSQVNQLVICWSYRALTKSLGMSTLPRIAKLTDDVGFA